MRKILHIDINSFYASVECLVDETLAGLPVAVSGAVSERHGVVLAKNQIAKKYGIKTGMTVYQAKKLAPDIVIKEANFALYIKYSKAVKSIFREYTDYVESFGIDEAWLDITTCRRLGGDAYLIADEIRNRVKTEVGLTVSIGISFNKIFAKLGSDMKKPDAITEIPYNKFKEIVWNLPVENLLYVGRSTKQKLNKLTVKTIGDLAKIDEQIITQHLGKWGQVLHSYARGEDSSEVKKILEKDEYKSIGNSLTFYRDIDNFADAETLILLLSESVCSRMKDYGYKYARTVSLSVTNNLLVSFTRTRTLAKPTCLVNTVANCAMGLLKENFDFSLSKIRGIGVSVSDFTNVAQIEIGEADKIEQKQETLQQAVEKIRDRFGRTSISRAVALTDEKFAELDIKDGHSLSSLSKKQK